MFQYYLIHYFNFKNAGGFMLVSLLCLIAVLTIVILAAKLKKHYKLNTQDLTPKQIRKLNHIHKVEVPESWKNAEDDAPAAPLAGRDKLHTEFLNDILVPTANLTADNVPVSKFLDTVTGMMPAGTAASEKRGIAADLPHWNVKNCMQCNWCASVCPHAVVRPFVMTEEEAAGVADAVPMKGAKDKKFTLGWSLMDCTGCGSCAEVCPARNKAITMAPAEEHFMHEAQAKFDKLYQEVDEKETPFKESTVKGAQLKTPLMEFSGACPGCGETPYAKLVTQLFGDRMFIANATGCSSMLRRHRIPSTKRAEVLHGQIPCSRITRNSVSVWQPPSMREETS